MQPDLLIELDNVDASLENRQVLHGINWRFCKDENWLIMGPNGSGKTTLLRLICGSLWPAPGCQGKRRYFFDDKPSESPVGLETVIAYLSPEFQQRYQTQEWDMTGEEVILTGIDNTDMLYERITTQQQGEVRKLVRRFKLTAIARKPFRELSQGELRKVLLLRALAGTPQILVLDEFCSGLDATSRKDLLAFIDKAVRAGSQVVMTAHRREEVLPSITHVLQLEEGKVVVQGPRKKVLPTLTARKVKVLRTRRKGRSKVNLSDRFLLRIRNADAYLDLQPRGFHQVLRKVNWEVKPGEHWAVTGPNGSGKSSLLRLVYGDITCALGGEVSRFGENGRVTVLEARHRMGFVSAELQSRYREDITVSQAVASGCFASVGLLEKVTASQRRMVQEALDLLGLTPLARRKITQLSFGQMRRVLLARALVFGPELLLLDEPLDGLDVRTREEMLDLFNRLPEKGVSLVMVSHHEEDFPAVMTHRLQMKGGRVIEQSALAKN